MFDEYEEVTPMKAKQLVEVLDDHYLSNPGNSQVKVNVKALDGRIIEGIITEVFTHSDDLIIIQASEEDA
jgi:hypothetical protein